MAVSNEIMGVATGLGPAFPISPSTDTYSKYDGESKQHARNDYALGWLAGEILADGSNSGQNKYIADGMFNRIACEHRVLQENCMDIVFQLISRMADQRTDQRNAYTVYRCRQIRDLLQTDPNFAEVRAMH